MQINLNNEEAGYLKKIIEQKISNKDTNSDYDKFLKRILKKLNKKPIKISSRKAKGRNLQKWVCEKIADVAGIVYDQQNDNCMVHSREMGQPGCDIILREKLGECLGLSIECKSSESFNLMKTIVQAKKNEKDETDWIIIYKNIQLRFPVVIIPWDLFKYYMYIDLLQGGFFNIK